MSRQDEILTPLTGCPGHYESGQITHAVRHKGRVIVIDHVPAEICSICGDVLLTPATVRKIEQLLAHEPESESTAPLYEFAAVTA